MISKKSKIIIPGAAGLVGQNLILLLKEKGYSNIVAIDKHPDNIKILKELHSDITVIEADLAEPDSWSQYFKEASVIIMLQAQISGKTEEPFIRNNIDSTKLILETAKKYSIPFIVHVSSSVVISVADDDYTNTKKDQEKLVVESGIDHCVLRPPLMFGWFDRKHLGWLSRFMAKTPVFPIPGNGKYLRQPLYVRDFCSVIIRCMELRPSKKIFNIIGRENIYYIDIIRMIKKVKKMKTLIFKIPYALFYVILKIYSIFDSDPPFTTDQLKAMIAGDKFTVDNWWDEFEIEPTSFEDAMDETHNNTDFNKYILEF